MTYWISFISVSTDWRRSGLVQTCFLWILNRVIIWMIVYVISYCRYAYDLDRPEITVDHGSCFLQFCTFFLPAFSLEVCCLFMLPCRYVLRFPTELCLEFKLPIPVPTLRKPKRVWKLSQYLTVRFKHACTLEIRRNIGEIVEEKVELRAEQVIKDRPVARMLNGRMRLTAIGGPLYHLPRELVGVSLFRATQNVFFQSDNTFSCLTQILIEALDS